MGLRVRGRRLGSVVVSMDGVGIRLGIVGVGVRVILGFVIRRGGVFLVLEVSRLGVHRLQLVAGVEASFL